jgi:hypothetical protein
MAYAQLSQSDGYGTSWPWLLGFGIFGYLWYEGYLAKWLSSSTTPSTSVTTASTTPTVTQVANGTTNPAATPMVSTVPFHRVNRMVPT